MGITFIGGGGGGIEDKASLPPVVLPTATLPDTQFIASRINVPAGRVLNVWGAGVQTQSNTIPAGLNAVVRDETNAVDIVSENSKSTIQTSSPIGSVQGPVDISFRTENETGGQQQASSFFVPTLEEQ